MAIKKTLVMTTKQDVSCFTDEYLEQVIEKTHKTAALCDATIVECKVVKEEQEEETPVDLIDQWLKSIGTAAPKESGDYPVLRIESNGTILKFDANDIVQDDDERSGD